MRALSQSLMFAIAVAVPAVAAAQPPARTFDELSQRLSRADDVWITDTAGRETKSRVVDIGASMLTVETKSGRLDLRADDVVRVRQRRPDPLWNGALIGGLAAAAFPLAYFSKGYETGESLGENVESVLFVAAIGAFIGAAIDSRIKGRKVVYERPAGRTAWLITPAFGGRRVGVQVSFRIRE